MRYTPEALLVHAPMYTYILHKIAAYQTGVIYEETPDKEMPKLPQFPASLCALH